MVSLKDIGLGEETAEIVLTTYGPDGKPHASTMGVKAAAGSKVLLRVFSDTQTFRNLVSTGGAIINIVRDTGLLAGLALKDLLNFDVSELKFVSSKCVNAPRLKDGEAFVEIEVQNFRKGQVTDQLGTSEVGYFETKVKCVEVGNLGVRAIRRTESIGVESAILATKIIEAMKKKKKKISYQMFHKLLKYKEDYKRGSPNSKDYPVIEKIVAALSRRFGWQG